MKTIELKITDELSGKDIKSILFNHLKLSAHLVTKLKKNDGIKLNFEHATVRKIVSSDDILTITLPDENSKNIPPTPIELDIIYEDEDILLVNKPAFMPTHPSIGNYKNTLANAVMYYYKDTNFVFRAVNRLDRDTTGLVLIAKNQYSANILNQQIKKRAIKKEYLAICSGIPENDIGTIEAPIGRIDKSIIKRAVSPDGQYAKTDYEVIGKENGNSLVKLTLHTGRTHQIRVHMAHIGCPLYADFIYGTEIEGERTRLHCHRLEFSHPSTNKTLSFTSPVPDDFFITDKTTANERNAKN